jgi:hypothetical protein
MEVKLRYYWMPNLISGFNIPVKNLVEAYIASELFASLDLENGHNLYTRLISDFPSYEVWIQRQTSVYKAFRRQHSINSPFMIEMNTGGLSIKVGDDYEDWVDESETFFI